MNTYQITSAAGVDLGTYQAETSEQALDMLARDAGYRDQADAEDHGLGFDGMVEEVSRG